MRCTRNIKLLRCVLGLARSPLALPRSHILSVSHGRLRLPVPSHSSTSDWLGHMSVRSTEKKYGETVSFPIVFPPSRMRTQRSPEAPDTVHR